MTEVKVPVLPESIADATVAKWYVNPGDSITRDQHLVDLETDKVMLEVQATEDGVLEKILKKEGTTVTAEEVLAIISAGGEKKKTEKGAEKKIELKEQPPTGVGVGRVQQLAEDQSPAVRRLLAEHDIDIADIQGTGKDGRVTKQDVVDYMEEMVKERETKKVSAERKPEKTEIITKEKFIGKEREIPITFAAHEEGRPEQRVPMSRLRARIAERLVQVQHTTASLTTFNEVNMQPVIDIRSRYKDEFEKRYNVRLGFMSFFVKAAVEALKRFPAVNASIDGQDVIYHGYFDIGIAVSTPRGLVVPVIRNADELSMAEIEEAINEFAGKARDNKLTIEEMTGGTFTITNGGVFGSMLSTPIINPPQSAILGMHNIVKRAVVEEDKIIIRPIMYLALSYDHRIIDGRESVTFLVTIKNLLEDPARLMLEI